MKTTRWTVEVPGPLRRLGVEVRDEELWAVSPAPGGDVVPLPVDADEVASAADARLRGWAAGAVRGFEGFPLAERGTAFQREVWSAARTIPRGRTWSYGHLARAIGRPGAARAVGAALGANPWLVVVPCHRVIGSDGSLTGFACGREAKRWLLDRESPRGAEPRNAGRPEASVRPPAPGPPAKPDEATDRPGPASTLRGHG